MLRYTMFIINMLKLFTTNVHGVGCTIQQRLVEKYVTLNILIDGENKSTHLFIG